MNTEAREIFDRITMMSPNELAMKQNSHDLAFLRARGAYLRPEQLEVFKDVLGTKVVMTPEAKAEFDKLNQLEVNKATKKAQTGK